MRQAIRPQPQRRVPLRVFRARRGDAEVAECVPGPDRGGTTGCERALSGTARRESPLLHAPHELGHRRLSRARRPDPAGGVQRPVREARGNRLHGGLDLVPRTRAQHGPAPRRVAGRRGPDPGRTQLRAHVPQRDELPVPVAWTPGRLGKTEPRFCGRRRFRVLGAAERGGWDRCGASVDASISNRLVCASRGQLFRRPGNG